MAALIALGGLIGLVCTLLVRPVSVVSAAPPST